MNMGGSRGGSRKHGQTSILGSRAMFSTQRTRLHFSVYRTFGNVDIENEPLATDSKSGRQGLKMRRGLIAQWSLRQSNPRYGPLGGAPGGAPGVPPPGRPPWGGAPGGGIGGGVPPIGGEPGLPGT